MVLIAVRFSDFSGKIMEPAAISELHYNAAASHFAAGQ